MVFPFPFLPYSVKGKIVSLSITDMQAHTLATWIWAWKTNACSLFYSNLFFRICISAYVVEITAPVSVQINRWAPRSRGVISSSTTPLPSLFAIRILQRSRNFGTSTPPRSRRPLDSCLHASIANMFSSCPPAIVHRVVQFPWQKIFHRPEIQCWQSLFM